MTSTSNEYVNIVSGIPRSGTSMMMRMLDVGGFPVLVDNIRPADDDNANGYYEFEPVKQIKTDNRWLPNAYGKVLKIIYMLLYDLPSDYSYRVIFMKRTLAEVVASQTAMLKRQNKASAAPNDAELALLYQEQIQRVEHWLLHQPNFSVLYVDYNQLLKETPDIVGTVEAFLGRTLNGEAMIRSVDLSLYHQRK